MDGRLAQAHADRVGVGMFQRNTAEALLKADPDRVDVIRDSAKALVSEGIERVKGKLNIGQNDDDAKR